jgi:hypothetical protein
MPTVDELLYESEVKNATLQSANDVLDDALEKTQAAAAYWRKIAMGQQLFISQMRAECSRLRTLRLRVATGELADRVDMERELGAQKEFLPASSDDWGKIVTELKDLAVTSPELAAVVDKFA